MRRAVAAGVLAALLLVAAERSLPWLAWLVPAPLAAVARAGALGASNRWRGAISGASFGLIAALLGEAPWLVEAGREYFGLPTMAAIGAAIALSVACGSLAGALLGTALQRTATLRGPWVIAGGAVWSTWEALLVIAFPSYPWASLAATQVATPAVLQAASLAGQAGLTFLVATAGLAVGGAAVARGSLPRTAWALAATAVGATTVGFGALRLDPTREVPGDARHGIAKGDGGCAIAGIDAGISSDVRLDEAGALARYGDLGEKARGMGARVIVWPESALLRDPHLDTALRVRLQQWAGAWQAALLVGAPRIGWDSRWSEQRFNSLIGVAAAGPLVAYDKRALVPFAESWPVPFVERPTWLPADEISRGERAGRLDLAGCSLGVLICFEADRPELARELAAGGAQAIVIATNDAQLPASAVRDQVAQAQMRAVETGLPVLRVANRGESLAIDRFGRVAAVADAGVVSLRAAAARPALAVEWGGIASAVLAVCAVLSVVLPLPRSG